jgi:hypothetical protein
MEGESGNDTFVIRAFIAEDDIIADGGNDDDYFEYNINAPVSINGGLGFDTVVAIGTEKADAFIITDQGIFGAGLNISSTAWKRRSRWTASRGTTLLHPEHPRNVITTVIGGLGSDTFNVAGDVTRDRHQPGSRTDAARDQPGRRQYGPNTRTTSCWWTALR